MKSPDLVSFFVVMTPVWCLLAYWAWEWMTLRKIPDPKPGDIWRSQYSGRAIRIERVRLTDCGTLSWDFAFETAKGEYNCIPMSGYDRRNWRFMVREEKRVLENTTQKGPQC